MNKKSQTNQNFVLYSIIILFIFIYVLLSVLLTLNGGGQFREGAVGFFSQLFFRLILCAAALTGAAAAVKWQKNKRAGNRHSALLTGTFAFLAAAAVIFFLLAGPVSDLTHWDNPRFTVLTNLDFEQDNSGDSVFYHLKGTDNQGEPLSFSLTYDSFLYGELLSEKEPGLSAHITYLPNTRVIMSLEYVSATARQTK